MKKWIVFYFVFVIFNFQKQLLAQDKLKIKFGKVMPQDFDVTPPATDSVANAVVVADWGSSEFVANTNDLSVSLEFRRKTRIKIVNKNGFDAATISIYLYSTETKNATEKLEGLKAFTYNLEDGNVVETKVENNSVFTEKKDKHWIIKKFTFPALKEGSIIEYSYIIKSDFITNLQSWSFQGEYPCLWSEYNAGIPEFYKYVTLSQGYQSFFINKVDQSQVRFTFREREDISTGYASSARSGSPIRTEMFEVNGLQDNHQWVMKNVPGLKPEAYTTTINNHIAKIEFQLSQVKYPNSLAKFYMNDWGKVAEEMNNSDKFGFLINKSNGWLDEYLKQIIGNAATADEKAKKIFEYLRDNIFNKSNHAVYASTNLKEVIKNKSGTVADINLLLVAMLRHEKIDANPIILGKRSVGITNEIYPLLDRYNYVIAKAIINNETVYLDASQPKLGFGKLPLECYNGHAREVTKDVLSPVYFNAGSLKENSIINNIIINDDSTKKPIGIVNNSLGYYASLQLRNQLANIGIEAYKKNLKATFPEDIEVKNLEIDSTKKLDEPIALKFTAKYSMFGDNEIVYFNPLLDNTIKKNPFASAQRFYPVEMPYTQNDVYILNMEIPKGYMVDEMPKSARIKLNEDEGMFEYIIMKDATNIQMRVRLMINKASFTNEDYETLRDFYAFIVKKESEQIVFKKVK